MLTPEQLKEREGKIFATDAPAALGLSKYKTPVELWREKRGEPMEPREESSAMHWGTMLEPVIAREYANRTGVRLREAKYTKFHPTYQWMGSHFDYVADSDSRGVEIKNFHIARRKEFGEEGTDEVPMEVLIQCLHEAIVHGWKIVDVAVLFGGQDFGIWSVPNDPETAKQLIEQESEFMRLITSGEEPKPRTAEEARLLWPSSFARSVQAEPNVAQACADLAVIKEKIKMYEEMKGAHEAIIQTAMGKADTIMQGQTILATWKSSKETQSFEKDRFAEELPEVYKSYLVTKPGSRRFLLK